MNAPVRPGPRTVGHRGASALAPENTLRSIELAIDFGLDLVEVDVYLSRDGELVVIHDEDLRRVVLRPGTVPLLAAALFVRGAFWEGPGGGGLSVVLVLGGGRAAGFLACNI